MFMSELRLTTGTPRVIRSTVHSQVCKEPTLKQLFLFTNSSSKINQYTMMSNVSLKPQYEYSKYTQSELGMSISCDVRRRGDGSPAFQF